MTWDGGCPYVDDVTDARLGQVHIQFQDLFFFVSKFQMPASVASHIPHMHTVLLWFQHTVLLRLDVGVSSSSPFLAVQPSGTNFLSEAPELVARCEWRSPLSDHLPLVAEGI